MDLTVGIWTYPSLVLHYCLDSCRNVWILFVHSTSPVAVVPNLDPNTRYEFVVRLHVNQISSPWSTVVYHRTLPAGNKMHYCYILIVVFSLDFPDPTTVQVEIGKRRNFKEVFFILNVFPVCAAPSHPPAGVRVTLIEDDTALVSWREPTEPNVVITHYTILYASQKAWLAGRWQIMRREGEWFSGLC